MKSEREWGGGMIWRLTQVCRDVHVRSHDHVAGPLAHYLLVRMGKASSDHTLLLQTISDPPPALNASGLAPLSSITSLHVWARYSHLEACMHTRRYSILQQQNGKAPLASRRR